MPCPYKAGTAGVLGVQQSRLARSQHAKPSLVDGVLTARKHVMDGAERMLVVRSGNCQTAAYDHNRHEYTRYGDPSSSCVATGLGARGKYARPSRNVVSG